MTYADTLTDRGVRESDSIYIVCVLSELLSLTEGDLERERESNCNCKICMPSELL